MLIEQAFLNLPEILVGARYPTQGYEGGLVAAFGMAVLQELNGRNANNPISHLIAERIYQIDRIPRSYSPSRYLYEIEPFTDLNQKPRYLRADLHVTLGDLRTGTRALARYGWRSSNWIEAKFFRDYPNSHCPAKPINGGLLVADLIRLMALPPIELPRSPRLVRSQTAFSASNDQVRFPHLTTGRYLLHVYQGLPKYYHGFSRNKDGDKPGGKRRWLEALLQPGTAKITTLDLENERDSFLKPLNPELAKLDCECMVTNFVVAPSYERDRSDAYICVLTRLDSYSLTLGDDKWQVTLAREGIQSSLGAFDRIRRHVGNFVHAKEQIEEVAPKLEDTTAESEAEANNFGESVENRNEAD